MLRVGHDRCIQDKYDLKHPGRLAGIGFCYPTIMRHLFSCLFQQEYSLALLTSAFIHFHLCLKQLIDHNYDMQLHSFGSKRAFLVQ